MPVNLLDFMKTIFVLRLALIICNVWRGLNKLLRKVNYIRRSKFILDKERF